MSQHTYHAEDILLFLEQNPHFFEQNSHLLTHLKWPSSEQEGVIHFTEHKAELLQRENKQLKEQLQTIIHNAQRSENIRQRLHQWACKLIMNRTWAKQPDKMANELKKLFALDEVQIILEDNLNKEFKQSYTGPVQNAPKRLALPAKVKSLAYTPLIEPKTKNTMGLLVLGAYDQTHFSVHMATDFLEHLGALCAAYLSQL